jgi:penicillin-binding protein 1C
MRRLIRRTAIAAAITVAALAALRLAPHEPLSARFPLSRAVLASKGELLRLTLAADEQYRLWTPIAEIAPSYLESVIAYEDRQFRFHPGINPVTMARAAWVTYGEQSRRMGGSTITMQLARKVYRIDSATPTGKVRQMLAALWLEARYSKREILEAYVNLVPFSSNVEGVGAASLVHFGKRPIDLTWPESVALAVIPQHPAKRGAAGVESAREAARNRLIDTLAEMHPDFARKDVVARLPQSSKGTRNLPFLAPHLADYLVRQPGRSGVIASTLDLKLQSQLEQQITRHVSARRQIGVRNASAMLVDTRTMDVVALAGSADFFDREIEGQVNGAFARRSPGSTLKPFVYALALDQGLIHSRSILKDAPQAFGPYTPENFDGTFLGPVAAQDALVKSRNIPAVALAARLAQPSLHQFLRTAGVGGLESEERYGLSIALGGAEMSMEELAMLYAMLANRGELRPLNYVKGKARATGTRLLSEEAAFITLEMLKDNPRPDHAAAPGLLPTAVPVAWKTGTSWGFRDAWTAGAFGPYVLVAWVGNFNNEPNAAFIGVETAAPLFFAIVDSIAANARDLRMPDEVAPKNARRVQVCAASGDLPNAQCPALATAWFIPGKSPIKVSNLHRAVWVDAATGREACNAESPGARLEVHEYWPSDLLRLFAQAGVPRRLPPATAQHCGDGGMNQAQAPRIVSPLRGVDYVQDGNAPAEIALKAVLGPETREAFWFVDGALLGSTRRGEQIAFAPRASGRYAIRVVDDSGMADAREVNVKRVR